MTEVRDWIAELKILAEAGELDESSLDPAILLGISESKITELKRKGAKKLRDSAGVDNVFISSAPAEALETDNLKTLVQSVGSNKIIIRYLGRNLNTKTSQALLNSVSDLVNTFVSQNNIEGFTFLFDFTEDISIDRNTLLSDNKILLSFPINNLEPMKYQNKNILATELSKPRGYDLNGVVEDKNCYASSKGELLLPFNPFMKKSGSNYIFSTTVIDDRCEIIATVLENSRNIFEYKQTAVSGETSDYEIFEAIQDIEILRLLFKNVATDSTKRLDEAEREVQRNQNKIKSSITDMLSDNGNRTRLEKQIAALQKTADQTGIDFDEEIARLKTKLDGIIGSRNTKKDNIKNYIQNRKTLDDNVKALRKEMSGYRGQQLIRALTELRRIRENKCVYSAGLKEKGSELWLDIRLHPVVVRNDRTNYMLDQLHFQMAVNDSRHLKIKWFWDKNELESPHPHVDSSGTTCWGQAGSPIQDALGRQEISTAIRYITGWASQYNHSSPYVALLRSHFPTTTLSPGWHPELSGKE